MDIDKCLAMLREMCQKIDVISPEEKAEMSEDIAMQFDALDRWLSRRGFLPDAWNNARPNE